MFRRAGFSLLVSGWFQVLVVLLMTNDLIWVVVNSIRWEAVGFLLTRLRHARFHFSPFVSFLASNYSVFLRCSLKLHSKSQTLVLVYLCQLCSPCPVLRIPFAQFSQRQKLQQTLPLILSKCHAITHLTPPPLQKFSVY